MLSLSYFLFLKSLIFQCPAFLVPVQHACPMMFVFYPGDQIVGILKKMGDEIAKGIEDATESGGYDELGEAKLKEAEHLIARELRQLKRRGTKQKTDRAINRHLPGITN